jgi:hypothetical protein
MIIISLVQKNTQKYIKMDRKGYGEYCHINNPYKPIEIIDIREKSSTVDLVNCLHKD